MNILMPAMSPTMESGTLAKWLVKVGDPVRPGDVIAEIETDKATMEVEATDPGIIAEILVAAGTEEIPVAAPIARLAANSPRLEDAPAGVADPPGVAAADASQRGQILSPAAQRLVEEHNLDPASLDASGRGGRVTKGDALAALARTQSATLSASLLARKIASQTGIDLTRVGGTGPGGRIRKTDIVAPRASAPAPPRAAGNALAVASPSSVAELASARAMAPAETADFVALDGMRKTIARRMSESFREVPHFPLTIDVELDELLATRAKINAMLEGREIKVSVNDMALKAAAVALQRVPEVNASYTPEGILLHHRADIAMAVAISGGLITPIIRACDQKGLAQISTEARDLAERARNRKLKPDEFQGGTFSVSNLGMFGIRTFSSIINEPQGAILSIGSAEARPVVRGGQVQIASMMSVTLTCDHRAMDGASAARWLQEFKSLIEFPLGLAV